jgi:uncharacterized protein (TIGR00266 family)
MTALQYRIEGSDLQFVEVVLPPGQSMIGEPGSMMFIDDGITMDTRLGDGIDEGLFARVGGAFKRWLTGESIFSTLFANAGQHNARVAFAAPLPGKIMAVDLAANGGALICQKGAFLAGTQGVRVSLAFKKRLRVGFLGGEGFIMQKLTGDGTAFIHATGTLTEMHLQPGQSLRVDTGCLAALQTTASYDIKYVGKLKTSLFGGEGMFFAQLKGPGTVWLQSLPVRRLTASLLGGAGRQGGLGRFWYFLIVIAAALIALFTDPSLG